ncbi:MAG: bacteriocin [Gemmatimonadota bacterium]
MNGLLELEPYPAATPVDVRLLSEEELAQISGGWGVLAAGAAIAGAGLAVAVIGVAVGAAVYYFTR